MAMDFSAGLWVDTDGNSVLDALAGSVLIDLTNTVASTAFLNGNRTGNPTTITLDGSFDVTGTAGDDIITLDSNVNVIDGGGGNDRVSYRYAGAGVVVNLANVAANSGDAAGDSYTNVESFAGSDGFRDTLLGTTGADFLLGLGGDDSVAGGDGADVLQGNAGNDTLDGGADNDSLVGGDASDNLLGGAGNDTLYGGNDDDTLAGGADADELVGGAGIDTASYFLDGSTTVDLANQALNAGGALGDHLTGVETIQGGLFGANNLFGDSVANTFYGGLSADMLNGRDGDDTIYSSGGSDTMIGGKGNDRLNGGNDGQSMNGGDGNDVIYGGADGDTMTGGAGSDTFIFTSGFAGATSGTRDVITDFVHGVDVLDLLSLGLTVVPNFTGGGADEVRIVESVNGTTLNFDTNSDKVIDAQIFLRNTFGVTVDDLILV